MRLVQGGRPRREMLRQFGMSATSLRDWRRDYASGRLSCLKEEFGLGQTLPSFAQATDQVARAVRAYNELPRTAAAISSPRSRPTSTKARWCSAGKTITNQLPPADLKTILEPYLAPL